MFIFLSKDEVVWSVFVGEGEDMRSEGTVWNKALSDF